MATPRKTVPVKTTAKTPSVKIARRATGSASKTTPAKTTTRTRKTTPVAYATSEAVGDFHAYIPSIRISQKYVHRQIFGVPDFDILRNARKNGRNILLMGDTGSGKTMVGQAFASEERLLYYSVPCDVSIDPTSLSGKMVPTDVPGKYEWQDGPVTTLVRNGGVLNISEINFMPPKIAASLYPLLDGRRQLPLLGHKGEIVIAHPDLLVIADMNPAYRGTMELNAAFKNRFPIKIEWGYDDDVEKTLVKSPTLRAMARQFREMFGVEIRTPIATNMLMEFEEFAADPGLGLDWAIGNFVAAFGADERKSVDEVIGLNRDSLTRDLAFIVGGGDIDSEEFEEIEGTFEVSN